MKQPFNSTPQPKVPIWSWVLVAILVMPLMVLRPGRGRSPWVQLYLEPDTAAVFWMIAPWFAAASAILAFVLKLRADHGRKVTVVQSAEAALRPAFGYALLSAAFVWILTALYMPVCLVLVGHPGATHSVTVGTAQVVSTSPYQGCRYPAFIKGPTGPTLARDFVCLPSAGFAQKLWARSDDKPTETLLLTGWGNGFGVFYTSMALPQE